MAQAKHWIKAFRLRTLPLALSSILLGSFLTAFNGMHVTIVTVLSITTTILLQVLSNLANDYGDAVSGADNEERVGPERAVQSGAITAPQMKKAVILFAVLSLISGLALIYFGTQGLEWTSGMGFLGLGILAIAAAIKYTMGKNPYGYKGFGDVFVFLFFGLIGVGGTYFLHTHTWDNWVLLPAAAIGLLSSAVLNLNNMRDRESDAKVGKFTLVVKIGIAKAKIYHITLIAVALVLPLIYIFQKQAPLLALIYLATLPILLLNIKIVLTHKQPRELDPELKKVALSTFLLSLLLGIGMVL